MLIVDLANETDGWMDYADLVRQITADGITPPHDLSAEASRQWEEAVLEISPVLGPFLVRSIRNGIDVRTGGITVVGIRNDFRIAKHQRQAVSVSIDMVLHWLGTSVALICAAGGAKQLVLLLRVWVEAKAARSIRIRKGDLEFEIKGGLATQQEEAIVRLLETEFGKLGSVDGGKSKKAR